MKKIPQSGPSPFPTLGQNYTMHETIAVVDDEKNIGGLVSLHLIQHLRSNTGSVSKLIKNVYGMGYKLEE